MFECFRTGTHKLKYIWTILASLGRLHKESEKHINQAKKVNYHFSPILKDCNPDGHKSGNYKLRL